ncbi:MAG TPA: folylpolyglutamate synthase/dihydrofolate synthase family protein [Candidatus Gastranaerophilales bacterium]|nr:folylpolyglutamate synthase/dihydrofolate synthase family protein [Candidatus Gastranaerophilales bacterium]
MKVSKEILLYNESVSLLTAQGKFHINLGLERVEKILDFFGNPQNNIKCVHVAGTNGKGSTCAMLASVLKEAGYKTGLYTSPHLVEYTERIKINDEEISKQEFAELMLKVAEYSGKQDIPATEFEILTAAAFIYFYEKQVDIAIIETGLGGRLDATNTVKNPELAIITDIDFDHTARLGETIEQIAVEKAGIIKQNVPIITIKDNNGLDIIQKKAVDLNSILILSNPDNVKEVETGLKGSWQKRNLSLTVEAFDILRKKGFIISEEAEKTGLKNVKWAARFEYIEEKHLLIDAAHNPAGAKALRQNLDQHFPKDQRLFIYSALNTKDYKTGAESLFREQDVIILTKNASPYCENPENICEYLKNQQKGKKIYITQNIEEAMKLYAKINKKKALTILTGSIYTIGEFLAFNKQKLEGKKCAT